MLHLSKPCGHGCAIWANPVAMDVPFEPTLWPWMLHLSQPSSHGCSIWANPVAMDVPFEPTLWPWMFHLSWHWGNAWTTWAKIQPWIVHMSQPSRYKHWIWANPTTMDATFQLIQQPWMFHLTQECSHGCSIWGRPAAIDAPDKTGSDWVCLTTTHVLQDILAVLPDKTIAFHMLNCFDNSRLRTWP